MELGAGQQKRPPPAEWKDVAIPPSPPFTPPSAFVAFADKKIRPPAPRARSAPADSKMEHNVLAAIAALGENLGARLDHTSQTVADLAQGVQGEIRRATAAEEKLFQHFSRELELTNGKLSDLEEKISVLSATVQSLSEENKALRSGAIKAASSTVGNDISSYSRPVEARILQCNSEHDVELSEFTDTLA